MIRLVRILPLAVSFLLLFSATTVGAADPGGRLIDSQPVVHEGQPSMRLRVAVDNAPGPLVPQKAGEWRREERHVTDPVTGEEEVWVLEGPAPDLSLRSFLVAVPDGYAPPAEPHTVVGEMVDAATGELLAEYGTIEGEIRPARVGMVRAAQVFYRLPETERAVEARFDVAFAPEAGPRRTSARRAERSVASLFVNPEDAVVLRAADRRSSAPDLLQPPGDQRIAFTADHRVYRVPMASLGVDGETVDSVRLIHHGAVLPFGVEGEDIVFYAQRRVTDADTDDSVFLKLVEEGASPRLTTRPAFATLPAPESPAEVEVVRNRRYDWNLVYEPTMVENAVGSKFAFHRLAAGTAHTHQLPIHDLLTNTFVSLRVEFHGRSIVAGFDPDHYAVPSFGGVSLTQVTWKGKTKRIANYNFTIPSLPSGPTATLPFQHHIPGNSPVVLGGNADAQYLDVVEVTYLAKPRLEGGEFGRLRLAAAGSPRRVTMGGFPAGTNANTVLVLDVTVPDSPVLVTDVITFDDESGTVAVTFEASSSAAIFHFEHLENLLSPDTAVDSETLPEPLPTGIPLRGIVVRDESYGEAMQPWISHRGPGVMEICPQAAYNVFNGGQSSPEAIRDALGHIIESAEQSVAVPFVVLVGHGSFDRRNYLGFKSVPWIPAFIEEGVVFEFNPETLTGTTVENSVDLSYGLLFGEDNLLDVQLARWPVKSPTDIERIVERAIGHDAMAGSLTRQDRPAYFLAQNDPIFRNDQAIWTSLYSSESGFTSVTMVQGVPVPELGGLVNTPAIRKSFERFDDADQPFGASVFFYTGHGNYNLWSGQLATSYDTNNAHPINNANVKTFATTNQWPIVGTFTCLNGNYAAPGREDVSMAEAWLFSSDYGAVANIGPCGVDYYNEQRLLQGAYLTQLGKADPANRAATVGQMSHRASVQYATQYPSLMKTLREYIVFGDPLALTTVVPQEAELAVTVESSADFVKDGEPFELTVMVENIGSHEARGVELQLPLPTGVTALGVESDWGGISTEGGMVILSFGSLLPGQGASGIVTVVTEPGSPNPVELIATAASITPPAGDPPSDTATVIILRTVESMSIY